MNQSLKLFCITPFKQTKIKFKVLEKPRDTRKTYMGLESNARQLQLNDE